MKRLIYPLLSVLAFLLVFTACEEEELELGATTEAQFEQEMVADEVNTVRLTANDNGPAIYRWTLSTGQKFEGKTIEVYLPFKGEYEVTLTAYSQGGSTSSTGTVTIAETDPEICNVEVLKLLTGGCGVDEGKTWVIDSTSKGHFGIGPATSNTPDWYSANPGDKAGRGMYNDRYTFKLLNYKVDINTQGDVMLQQGRSGEFSNVEVLDEFDAVAQVSYDEPFTYSYTEQDGSYYIEIQGEGFLGYYTGQTRYEIVSISENEVFLKYDEAGAPGNAWYIRLVPEGFTPPPPPPPATSTLPITFEDVASPFNGFGGSTFQVIDNPDASGINTSAKVGELVKGSEVWAGIETTLEQTIDFTAQPIVKIKVWSPVTGVARLKFEDSADNTSFTEFDANIETTGEWVELTYDFSSAPSNVYDKMALFLDFGSERTETFYFDDIRQEEKPIEPAELTLAALTGGGTKTWVLRPSAGSFGVGPAKGSDEWFPNGADISGERPCLFNDQFIFKADGVYEYAAQGDVFAEGYMGIGQEGCVDESALTGDAAVWASGTHSFTLTPATDTEPAYITVTGLGAFVALPKAYNGGEYQNPPTESHSITYEVLEYGTNGSQDVLKLTIDISEGETGGAFWNFVLISQ